MSEISKKNYSKIFNEFIQLRENPPALPGALISGALDDWLSKRQKLITELSKYSHEIKLSKEQILKLEYTDDIEYNYLILLKKLKEAISQRLKIIHSMKDRSQKYNKISSKNQKTNGFNIKG